MENEADSDKKPMDFPADISRPTPAELSSVYTVSQHSEPVLKVTLWDGKPAWLLTRYDDVRAVGIDPSLSGDWTRADFPSYSETRYALDRTERAFIAMDKPRHDHFRRMLTKEFAPKRIERMRPFVEKTVKNLLDDMEHKGPPADILADFAIKVPALTMCTLMGTPYEYHKTIIRVLDARIVVRDTQTSKRDALALAQELTDFSRDLVEEKERNPGDDLPSRLIEEFVKPGTLGRTELTDIISMIMRGGQGTTAAMISLGILVLMNNPAELAKLKADPTIIDEAIEELLRFITPAQWAVRRVAKEDTEIGGHMICAGDRIISALCAANRDASMFENGDQLDVMRDASAHVAFGYGIHQCLGQSLARMELETAYLAFFGRFPEAKLVEPAGGLKFRDMQHYGIEQLPVSW